MSAPRVGLASQLAAALRRERGTRSLTQQALAELAGDGPGRGGPRSSEVTGSPEYRRCVERLVRRARPPARRRRRAAGQPPRREAGGAGRPPGGRPDRRPGTGPAVLDRLGDLPAPAGRQHRGAAPGRPGPGGRGGDRAAVARLGAVHRLAGGRLRTALERPMGRSSAVSVWSRRSRASTAGGPGTGRSGPSSATSCRESIEVAARRPVAIRVVPLLQVELTDPTRRRPARRRHRQRQADGAAGDRRRDGQATRRTEGVASARLSAPTRWWAGRRRRAPCWPR